MKTCAGPKNNANKYFCNKVNKEHSTTPHISSLFLLSLLLFFFLGGEGGYRGEIIAASGGSEKRLKTSKGSWVNLVFC